MKTTKTPSPIRLSEKRTAFDYRKASQAICTLEIEKIEQVISSGIPLNEPRYTSENGRLKDTAIGLFMETAGEKLFSTGATPAVRAKVERIAGRMLEAGCDPLQSKTATHFVALAVTAKLIEAVKEIKNNGFAPLPASRRKRNSPINRQPR